MTNVPATFNPVRARTYCRNLPDRRETWWEVARRSGGGISALSEGYIDPEAMQNAIYNLEVFPAGRMLWVGGTDWVQRPKNHMAGFNCISLHLDRLKDIRDVFDLCCQGCGVGEILEYSNIANLPEIVQAIDVEVIQQSVNDIGNKWVDGENQNTQTYLSNVESDVRVIQVGDSREGWADAIFELLRFATTDFGVNVLPVLIDLSYVRPQGTPIKGFGGVANPVGLPRMFARIGEILKSARYRKLNDEELALIIDEGAEAVVAGNVRRSAGMKQFDHNAPNYKEKLYFPDDDGNYQVDVKRKPLRMSNHTKVHHTLPFLAEVKRSLRNQFETGEGAIQYAPSAIARANRDVLDSEAKRNQFIALYEDDLDRAEDYLLLNGADFNTVGHRLGRYGLNPCGEIIGSNFACNLSEVQLVNADPDDWQDLRRRFRLATQAGCAMLELDFPFDKLEKSRQLDPIIGVGLTGWFDFCVKKFGDDWMNWVMQGRPRSHPLAGRFLDEERFLLRTFNAWVNAEVNRYCDARNIKRPNRTTTIKPSGTLSQLSGACPGGHPSKASHFIRRITFASNDPVARACLRAGYNVVPSQRCTDADGNLLNDPFDERVDEWLVEIPVKAEWTKHCKYDWDTQEIPAVAQFDIAMQLQKYYAEHNVSYTIEFDENEINELSEAVWDEMRKGNYISFAMMQRARANQLKHTFPRLPYEPIDEQTYYELWQEVQTKGEKNMTFDELLAEEYQRATMEEASDNGSMGCDGGKCTL